MCVCECVCVCSDEVIQRTYVVLEGATFPVERQCGVRGGHVSYGEAMWC